MKKTLTPSSALTIRRVIVSLVLVGLGLSIAFRAFAASSAPTESDQEESQHSQAAPQSPSLPMQVGVSYHNDESQPLRDLVEIWPPLQSNESEAHEANLNPKIPNNHIDSADPLVQDSFYLRNLAPPPTPNIPGTVLNFDGIPFPGVGCNCAPPDTVGAVGATQYVQMVNRGYQVFNKTTGSSVLGPTDISTVWAGFGGVCQTNGRGDPVVLYDRIANRWLISQFAGSSVPTDECIAISTTSDATGSYFRYAFHLGSNFFDYPHLGVWPDAYYMADNVFNSSATARLGPQPFAFNRAAMLTGAAATFVSTANVVGGSTEPYFLPSDLDGATLPPANAPNTFISWPGSGSYKVWHFHVDFATPANSTFTLFSTVPAAGFTQICPTTRNCVPELGAGTSDKLDALGDRLMHRLAYRNIAGHESVIGTYTVSSSSVAALRWFEMRRVTAGPPSLFQEGTYQPDSTWRWMGSIGMDQAGNIALGYSASSASINPSIRYTGRLSTDPVNTMPQGEGTIIAGGGSQTGTGNRWGDYSALTIDPVDDCTFWFASEYYAANGTFNWRTRIANFKFAQCPGGPTPTPTPTPTPAPTPTPTPSPTATPSPTPTPIPVSSVNLPVATVTTAVTNFTQPVTTTNIPVGNNFVAFQGDFSFDSAVVSFQANGTSGAGLTATNWNVSSNIINIGPGTIKALRISAFSNDFTPLSGSGTLFNLNMVRVSSSQGTNSPLIWQSDPNAFQFITADLATVSPTNTPSGSITVQAATISISGSVVYCTNPSMNPVPGVTMTLTGTSGGSTTTNASGNYSFISLTSGGNYTVTPTKASLAPASAGINTVDVVAVQRHFLNITPIPPGCGLTAADVNGSATIDTSDVIAIQRFSLGLTTGIANVGKYQFTPVNRSYPGVSNDQTAQNYNALVLGDVASAFVHRPVQQPTVSR